MTQIQKSSELQEVHAELSSVNIFASKDVFEHAQRIALMLSKSELVPKRYQNNAGNCMIALEISGRIKSSPLMVMQNLDIIMGKPGWSSKFLIASLNASGKFSPLRYEEDPGNGGRVRAWSIDLYSKERVSGAWVSMEMAKAEGWVDKNGSKWKTMPELMLRYRAASFFVNQFAPEISMGFPTSEEIHDISYSNVEDAKTKIDKELERICLMIDDCESLEELEALKPNVPEGEAMTVYLAKEDDLKQAQ